MINIERFAYPYALLSAMLVLGRAITAPLLTYGTVFWTLIVAGALEVFLIGWSVWEMMVQSLRTKAPEGTIPVTKVIIGVPGRAVISVLLTLGFSALDALVIRYFGGVVMTWEQVAVMWLWFVVWGFGVLVAAVSASLLARQSLVKAYKFASLLAKTGVLSEKRGAG